MLLKIKQVRRWKKQTVAEQADIARRFSGRLLWAVLLLGGGVMGLPAGQIPLALYLVIGAVEVEALLKSCLPPTLLRSFLFVTASAGFFGAVLLFHTVLSLPPLLPGTALPVLLVSAAAILAERLCAFALDQIPRLRDADARYLGSAWS